MKNPSIILICVALVCCKPEPYYQVDIGTFPDSLVNMGDINSEYDDYNSASPTIGGIGPLCFS